MPVYVSLLRGINVGGRNRMKMADLRALYPPLGLENATSYLQSGNVVFSARRRDRRRMAGDIEQAIARTFGFAVDVLVVGADYVRGVVENNPFLDRHDIDTRNLLVSFLLARPSAEAVSEVEQVATTNDEFALADDAIYLHCRGGFGNSALSSSVLERKLGLRATTRNWRTVNALDRLAQDVPRTRSKA